MNKNYPDPELFVQKQLWFERKHEGLRFVFYRDLGVGPYMGFDWDQFTRPTAEEHRQRLIDFAFSHYGPGYGLRVVTAFTCYDRDQARPEACDKNSGES